jgi:hypothetical protein
MRPTKEQLLDTNGRPLTQGLFLEPVYNFQYAFYTLKDDDYTYKGKLYPSLKRLYLEMEDVTEYEFAKTYLLGWGHWIRIYQNKLFKKHIDEWREELEYKIRSRATKQMIDLAAKGNYQASKWLIDRGWNTRGAGRPSKAEKEAHLKQDTKISEEYSADVLRLMQVK